MRRRASEPQRVADESRSATSEPRSVAYETRLVSCQPRRVADEPRSVALAHVLTVIAGTQKHFPNGSFTLGNTTYTSTSLVQVFQGLVTAMLARSAAETGAKDALTAQQAAQAQVSPILRAYEHLVLVTFAGATQTLADFGLAPPKARTPLTAQQLAARTAKAKATRVARGTTSKKKKLAVQGDVTGVVVTPVTAPTAATPASPTPLVTQLSTSCVNRVLDGGRRVAQTRARECERSISSECAAVPQARAAARSAGRARGRARRGRGEHG